MADPHFAKFFSTFNLEQMTPFQKDYPDFLYFQI